MRFVNLNKFKNYFNLIPNYSITSLSLPNYFISLASPISVNLIISQELVVWPVETCREIRTMCAIRAMEICNKSSLLHLSK